MKTLMKTYSIIGAPVLTLLLLAGSAQRLGAKEKTSPTDPNDPTHRLFALLDSKFNGKLDDFCVLADLMPDPKNAGQELQHVIEIDYNKDMAFGKLKLHVRTVAQLTPDQLKTYTPKQTFDFAESDTAKFIKSDAGSFGRTGDLYLEASADGGPLTTVPITTQAQNQYEEFVTQYLLPALEKKVAEGNGGAQ